MVTTALCWLAILVAVFSSPTPGRSHRAGRRTTSPPRCTAGLTNPRSWPSTPGCAPPPDACACRFAGGHWRGDSGNWQGAGVGSSIDFQDHRPYLPGDDPRYIDWQAYARTGHYSMKLYREEVSPRVDVALDVSASMSFDDAKLTRALELFYFCVESARQSTSSLRCHAVGPTTSLPWPTPEKPLRPEELARLDDPARTPAQTAPAFGRVPWRQGSLRVVVSDLLFPGSPEGPLSTLGARPRAGA